MIAGVLSVAFLTLFPVVGVWFLIRSWRDGFSVYDSGGIFTFILGKNARQGFDAGFPIGFTIWGLGLALIGLLACPELMGISWMWPDPVSALLGRLAQVLFFGGALIGLSLLLFLFPRFLVPPHLRDERGWIREWWHHFSQSRRRRRDTRRG